MSKYTDEEIMDTLGLTMEELIYFSSFKGPDEDIMSMHVGSSKNAEERAAEERNADEERADEERAAKDMTGEPMNKGVELQAGDVDGDAGQVDAVEPIEEPGEVDAVEPVADVVLEAVADVAAGDVVAEPRNKRKGIRTRKVFERITKNYLKRSVFVKSGIAMSSDKAFELE